MDKRVYAVLLAGGKGTRLWPLSTAGHSKSFIRIGRRTPAIVKTISMLRGLISRENIIIVVNKAQEKLLKSFTRGIPERNILVEPLGRSTASAVGLAAVELEPDDIMVVLPTDSLIEKSATFKRAVKAAIDFVRYKENVLLCIGTRPKDASTAYGYIKVKSRQKGDVYSVDKFMEKPTEIVAQRLIKKPDYLWNAGMFIFKAKDILEAVKSHAPLLYSQLLRIKKDKKSKKAAYSRMKNVSIDYQIMEKVKNLYCLKAGFYWRDLGNWKSAGELFESKKYGNITFGKVTLIDTYDSIIYNSEKTKLGVVGLRDVMVVHTKNGTLVCAKEDAEKVRELVARL